MKITDIVEKPIFRTKIKSADVKIQEMIIGYFLAPFCAMLANSIFGAYLNRYYVDVLGWTKFGAFATLLPVVSVIFVILGNLMIGRWIDNTRTSQGKARPYLLLAVPMVVVAVILLFMTPKEGSNAVQMIWIAVSYNLYYAVAYPCFYTAHSSMVSLSTRDSSQRGMLATLSNAAMVASAGIGASIVVPVLLQSYLFVTGDQGLDIDASYAHWRIVSIGLPGIIRTKQRLLFTRENPDRSAGIIFWGILCWRESLKEKRERKVLMWSSPIIRMESLM